MPFTTALTRKNHELMKKVRSVLTGILRVSFHMPVRARREKLRRQSVKEARPHPLQLHLHFCFFQHQLIALPFTPNMATILCPRTTCLRSFPSAARTLSTPTTSLRAAFTTSSKPAPRFPTHPFTSNIAAAAALQTSRRCALTQIGLRHASQASASSSDVPEHILTWNRFFELRKKRRYLNLGCSVITALATVGVVTPILVRQDLDSWGAQISGIPDPTIVLGIYAFIVAAGGWLAGPSFGNAMFTVWAARRGWNKLIAEVS